MIGGRRQHNASSRTSALLLLIRELDGYAKEIADSGGRALAVPADVSKAEEVHAAFAQIKAELGDVDVLPYNAAMRPFGRLMDTKPSTFESTVAGERVRRLSRRAE